MNAATQPIILHIGADHAGVELKAALIQQLSASLTPPGAYVWKDHGAATPAPSVDYPDTAVTVCSALKADLEAKRPALGILICGSGIGLSIAANKISGINAALVENPVAARLARLHNDANVICLGARFLAADYAAEITRIFIETAFSNEPRHQKRVEKIRNLEHTT